MKTLGSVIEAQQFDRETLKTVFTIADKMAKAYPRYRKILRDHTMVVMFYEPSTRTRLSFEAAMIKLGGAVIGTENAEEFSSAVKGESLRDAAKVLSFFGDLLVLRSKEEGGAQVAAKFATIPVINAGDGPGQHPTQALLDLYTIQKEIGKLSGLKIALAGDLANGRTVRSLCYLLSKHFPDNEIFLVSPAEVRMKPEITDFMDKHGLKWHERTGWDGVIEQVQVVYQTRVQRERFKDDRVTYERVKKEARALAINKKILARMRSDAILLHPLPRDGDIRYGVDNDPRAKYFEQSRNGLFVRMALLKMILFGY